MSIRLKSCCWVLCLLVQAVQVIRQSPNQILNFHTVLNEISTRQRPVCHLHNILKPKKLFIIHLNWIRKSYIWKIDKYWQAQSTPTPTLPSCPLSPFSALTTDGFSLCLTSGAVYCQKQQQSKITPSFYLRPSYSPHNVSITPLACVTCLSRTNQ